MNLPERLSHLYLHIKQSLWGAGIMDTAERDSRMIIHRHTGYDWTDLIARPDEKVTHDDLRKIEADIEHRLSGMPISRIHGERAFWGLDFKLNKDTLDPRPDTETLIQAAVERLGGHPPKTILDLGTGSGCILIALLNEWPEARGVAIDKSLGALRQAKENAIRNNVQNRAHFICGSWTQSLNAKFDLIVSNPPYISNRDMNHLPPEVKNHDPILALAGGEDGLDAYRVIFTEMKSLLNPGGTGLFEIGYGQESDVMRLAVESALLVKDIHTDLGGINRVVEITCGDK